jgi:tellurite resistance protein
MAFDKIIEAIENMTDTEAKKTFGVTKDAALKVYDHLKVLIRQQKKIQRIERDKKFSPEELKAMKEQKAKRRAEAREELKAALAAYRKENQK